jgi:hypothetical protein
MLGALTPGSQCFRDGEGISEYDGCDLVGELFVAAHREVTGRE